MTAVIIAIAIVVVIGIAAGFYVLRNARAVPPPSPKTAPPPKDTKPAPPKTQGKPATKGKGRKHLRAVPPPEVTEEEVASVVQEAEAILAETTSPTEAEPSAPADEDGEAGTAVDLLDREDTDGDSADTALAVEPGEVGAEVEAPARPTFRERLGRTRRALAERIADVRMRRRIDDEVWEDLEEALILGDVGADLAAELVSQARERARETKAQTPGDVVDALKHVLHARLAGKDRRLVRRADGPTVWLVVGVNGTGKTTTIGKLAMKHRKSGEGVVLAAADTFRAAAADQLAVWADRSGAEVVRGQEGSDPGAVVFDAVSFTRARDCDLLIVDTAGRLHTKVNLMEELKKIRRVAESAGGRPDEVLLVLDATTGQNGLAQAREFAAAASVSGVVLTKLDGTAKGGIAFAVEQEFGLPIKLVGLGEGPEDLVPFDPDEFVEALFA
jgi:fused signal recognition particle receptor